MNRLSEHRLAKLNIFLNFPIYEYAFFFLHTNNPFQEILSIVFIAEYDEQTTFYNILYIMYD